MKKSNLIKKIIANTDHTIESIAEILDMEIEELQLDENHPSNEKIPHYKIQLLSDFLDDYSLTFEENSNVFKSSE